MPQLFSALRVLGRHTVMKSALEEVGHGRDGHDRTAAGAAHGAGWTLTDGVSARPQTARQLIGCFARLTRRRPCLRLRLAQERDPRPHLGRDRRGRRRHPALARALEDLGGADSPDLTTHCRGPGPTAGTPRPRQPAGLPPRRHPSPPLAHGVASPSVASTGLPIRR